MKVKLTVYYEDGTDGVIEIEKPAGAHPDSVMTAATGLIKAEKTGKRVAKIGRSKAYDYSSPTSPHNLFIDDGLVIPRQKVLDEFKRCSPQEFEKLFGKG